MVQHHPSIAHAGERRTQLLHCWAAGLTLTAGRGGSEQRRVADLCACRQNIFIRVLRVKGFSNFF
jgi:hypothetical protein